MTANNDDIKAQISARESVPHNAGSKWFNWTTQSLANQNRLLMKAVLIELGLIGLLIVTVIIIALSAPKPAYFATTPDLRVIKITGMDEPFISDSAIINLASRLVSETLGLDFKRYEETLMAAKPYYSNDGFAAVVAALKSSGTLEAIVKRKLISTVALDGAPLITAQGILKGKYSWKIKVPVIIEYESSEGVSNKQILDADLLISRADVRLKPLGVEILQLNLTPRR